MRLKEPMGGIKMGVGHVINHCSFFIIQTFFLLKVREEDKEDPSQHD